MNNLSNFCNEMFVWMYFNNIIIILIVIILWKDLVNVVIIENIVCI